MKVIERWPFLMPEVKVNIETRCVFRFLSIFIRYNDSAISAENFLAEA